MFISFIHFGQKLQGMTKENENFEAEIRKLKSKLLDDLGQKIK